ncbi:MAG: MarR family winged helix-turn-helix transcriptional regulator [Candidatus Dormibacteria bacterium]
MVGALFTLNASLDRARRERKGAATLSLLQLLGRDDGIRPSEIADAQLVHPSLVTRRVQDLEAEGLVQVVGNPSDRRSCLVKITPAGAAERRRLTQFGLERFRLFVTGWSDAELRTLTQLIAKLQASMANASHTAHPPAHLRRSPPAHPRGRDRSGQG